MTVPQRIAVLFAPTMPLSVLYELARIQFGGSYRTIRGSPQFLGECPLPNWPLDT